MTAIAVGAVDIAVNPNNTAQRYILWNNGRIDAIGGAVPVTDQKTWYTRFEPPGVALHITNWTTGSGYVLDYRGGFNPFGDAPDLGTTANDGPSAGVPAVAGIPVSGSSQERLYVDWSWDPAGTGQGYVMDMWGGLLPFGGATAPTQAGRRFTTARARRLEMRWSPSKAAVIMDMFGRLYGNFGTVPGSHGASFKPAIFDAYRDLVVMDWTAVSGYQLDLYGGMLQFGGRAPTYGWPYRPSGRARRLAVVSAINPERFWQVWAGAEQFEYVSSTPPTVIAGAGTSEVQTVTISGAPTGGTFTLTFNGQATAAIAYNATAAAMQTALRALSNIGSTGVTVTKSGQVFTVTFAGTLAKSDVAQMTATSSLTGGTSPGVSVATTTGGQDASPLLTVSTTTRPDLTWTYNDPQSDAQKAWQLLVFTQTFANGHTMTDPLAWTTSALIAREGVDPTARGIACPVDLPNGTYRLFVRAKDTADQWSPWDSHDWTQNVPVPATPTGLTATANQAAFSVALSVSATTGGSANLIRFEASDDAGVTWSSVGGADAVTLAATTTATDRFAPLGVTRTYRALAYAVDPRVISAPSNTATATLTTLTYVLTAVDDSSLGGRVAVQEPVEWTRPTTAGVFQGIGADYPTVVSDGRPKSKRSTVHVFTDGAAAYATIQRLVEADSVLVYRDPFGSVRYCRMVGDWSTSLFPGAATRSLYTTDLPLVEVRPPHLDA